MEYCAPYQQLMPVRYEKQDDGRWHKIEMACSNFENCKNKLECNHFKAAPETIEEKHLHKNKIGEQ